MATLPVEDCLDMPNLVDLFQQRKVRALALELGKDQIGEKSELIAFEEQHMPIGFRILQASKASFGALFRSPCQDRSSLAVAEPTCFPDEVGEGRTCFALQ